jgi:GTP diphosphokinase / guanosine-3',5'-bis(diphosphate) 3'-diphosphatase
MIDTSFLPSCAYHAFVFAAGKHLGQRRKGAAGTPYITHPLAVARLLAVEAGVTDATVLQAALLHDTVEDTRTSVAELEQAFGSDVAKLVAELTDDKALPKERRKQLQVERAGEKSVAAAMLKVADKTCNLRDLHSAPPEKWPMSRKEYYFAWARSVVNALPPVPERLKNLFDEACARGPR